MTERITKAPLKKPSRDDITMEVPRPATPIELPESWERPNFWQRTGAWLSETWFWTTFASKLVFILVEAKLMTKDTRSTIAGILRMVIVALVGWFGGDKIADATGLAAIGVEAFFAIWALVEAIVGIFNNKGNTEPAFVKAPIK